MEREQKLLSTHEADIAHAAQLNERLRNQLTESEIETANREEVFEKKVCGSNRKKLQVFHGPNQIGTLVKFVRKPVLLFKIMC